MKYAIISDIHANLSALKAVLKDVEAQHCTNAACLGDIVGYYSHPKECLDLIREMNIPCVKGNFDDYCGGEGPPEGFNSEAAAIEWTKAQLTEDDRAWLRNLKLVQVISGFTIVHSLMNAPAQWQYVFDKLAAAASFDAQQTSLCFFGHTHIPIAFVRDRNVRGGTFTKVTIEPGKQYFVNPGSVGQPRDHNPMASYVTYHLQERLVELHRVPYERSPGEEGEPAGFPWDPKPTGPSIAAKKSPPPRLQ